MALRNVDTALVTIDSLKEYLNIDANQTSRDGQLNGLVSRYSGAVSSFCGRKFVQTTYTNEYFDGNGYPDLWLPNWPITSISIYLDSARLFGSGTLLVQDVPGTRGSYYVYSGEDSQGRVTYLGGVWPEGNGNIKVTYTAGYADTEIPGPVAEGCMRLIARAWQLSERSAHATASEGNPAGGGSISFVTHAFPDDVVSLLTPYKSMSIAG